MGLIKQLLPKSLKFTPSSAEVDWTRIETLVHGPGAGGAKAEDTNSAVFACLMAIATAYPEPPLVVYKKRLDGNVRRMEDSPLQGLLDKPTLGGELTMEEILFWTAWAKHTDGNAYWLKVRSGNAETGNVIELWPISPTLIKPISNDGDWISYYKYKTGPNTFERVPVGNIVHFRLGIDDKDMRKGLAPLKALVRQISTDDEADKFVEALLKNYAVPGLVVVPAGGTVLDQDQADIITEKLRRKFGSDNRGNIAVMSKESTIQQFGFSPEELDLTVLHRVPEERISAVIGVPAIVAGLGAGLERATYDNARSMGEWFTERKLVPQWRADARKLNVSLKPDFISNPRITIDFDLTDVRALQEDEDAKYKRLQIAVGKPWITRNEARADVGLDPVEGWDEEDISPPEPEPEATDGEGAPADDEQSQGRKNGHLPGSKSIRTFDIPYGGAEHKALWTKAVNRAAKHEKKIAAMAKSLFEAQKKAILVRLESEKSLAAGRIQTKAIEDLADDPFSMDEWIGEFRAKAKPVLGGIVKDVGQVAAQDLEISIAFDVADPNVARFLEKRAQRFAQQVNETTWSALKDSLKEGIQAGEGIVELSSRVEAVMAGRIRSTPETIARTEALGAMNGGTLLSWEQSEVVAGKTWLAEIGSDRTRESHVQAHGQTVDLDEDFEVGDGRGPAPGQIGLAEEDINCRCTMAAVLK